jgi:hypothetical protein
MTKTQARVSRQAAVSALILCIAVLLAGGAVAACGDEQPAAPAGDPSISGPVASAAPVDGGDAVGSFLIDQGTGDYDKASISVTDETAWYGRDGDGIVTIDRPTASELTGKTVEVQFTGAVAESYPVQATAGWVIVGD